jgi:hypothetical protein
VTLFRCASAFVLLTISFAVVANAQTEKTFPTDDEINLVLTQTERAIQQYKPLIDLEEAQMGKSVTDAVAIDRKNVKSLEIAVKAFKGKPQGFNGPLGVGTGLKGSRFHQRLGSQGLTASSAGTR